MKICEPTSELVGRPDERSCSSEPAAFSLSGATMTSPSGLGVRAGRTDAGAPSPPVPDTVHQAPMHFGRGTPRTSSSRNGSNGSPASTGSNPNTASPSAACWPRASIENSSSSGAEYRYACEHQHNCRAPARYGQAPPLPTASPVRAKLGWGGPPLAGRLGPTFLLTRGRSDQSTGGVAAPSGCSNWASFRCWTWPILSPMRRR